MADNFDNYSMKVQARVDLPSNKDIDAQIRKLEKSISKLKVSGQFDDTALRNLTNQLNTLKANITTANFSPTALTELTNQVNRALQNINIGNINVGGVGNQAQQVGQQIGQQINQGVSQSLSGNTGVLDTFRRSLENIGMGSEEIDAVANRIENLGVKIEALNQSTSHTVGRRGNRDILSVDISGTDRLGQAIKLTEQYNMATGDLIRSMDSVSTAQQKAGSSTNTFAKQQSQAVTNLTNQINQLNRAANDQNKARPITDSTHLDRLSTAYNEIISAIQRMGNASSDTFVTEQNNVKTLISNYKSLVSEFRNAENVSTKMKGTDFASGLAIARNDLEKFKADAKDFSQIIQTINNLDTAISSVGDASSLNKFNDDLRVARSELAKIKSETSATNRNEKVGINVSGLQSQIADLQRISPEIDKFEANINGAKVTVQSLLTDLANVNTQSDFSVINSKWKAFTDSAKSAGIVITEVATKSDSLTEKVNKIQLSSNISDLETKYKRFGVVSQEVETNLKELKSAHDAVIQAKGTDRLATEIEKYDVALDKAKASLKELTTTQVSMNQRTSQTTTMQEWMRKNQKATKLCGDQVQKLIQECQTCDKVRFDQIKNEFKELQVEAGKAGKLGNTLFGGIIEEGKKFIQWSGVTGLLMNIWHSFKQGISTVKNLDTALVDLRKTTDATAKELENFYYSSNETAKQLGVSTEEVINATSAWSRLGYAIEDATTMAKNSAILASISPEMDIDTATDGLVSTLKAFKIEAEDSLDGVISKINIIGNTQAVDNNDVVDILTRSSSAMAEANNTLEETIALGVAATEITRDADAVGTMLKTVSMRIRGYDEETESYTADLENLSGTIADLTKTASSPGGISLFTDESKTTYKSTYQILKDISEIYDELDDKTQAQLLEALAGKRQGQAVAAIINNFENAEKSMNSMANSAGNAMQEMEVIYDSMDYKLNQTQETATGIAQNLFGREDMKLVIDVFNDFLGLLDKATDKLGLFGTLGLGAGAFAGFKNIGKEEIYSFKNCFEIADNNMCSLGY